MLAVHIAYGPPGSEFVYAFIFSSAEKRMQYIKIIKLKYLVWPYFGDGSAKNLKKKKKETNMKLSM